MRTINYYLVFCIIITGATLAGCGGSSEDAGKQQAAGTTSEKPLLKDADGDALQKVVSSYKGEKAVLLNVWATWCKPCVEEFPHIVALQRKYPEKLQVIFVSADFPDQREDAVAFLQKQGVNWTTYFKTGKDEPFIDAVSRDWSGALPFTRVWNIGGEEVAHWENKADFNTFEKHVEQAINP